MKKASVFLCTVLVVFGATISAGALQAKPATAPPVEGFSGDMAGVQEGTPVSGKMYFMPPNKLRMEQNAKGTQSILILDRTKKMMWIVNPAERAYVEIDLSSSSVILNYAVPG